jgi:hypothetical protein
MNLHHPSPWIVRYIAAALITQFPSVVSAVPYASGVRNTGTTNWEFVLNEAADSVTITRDGGNPLNLGALAAGRHAFSMAGFNNFEIAVAKNAPPGWAPISDPTNPFTNFTIPSGLAINADPATPYFGTVYVANSNPVPTERGRAMGDGVYALTADLRGVDLANNFAVVTDPNDTSQAKAPNWTVSGPSGTTSSPWRITLDEAGNLIVSDWSDDAGGIKYATRDLAMGGLILAGEGGVPAGNPVHGSIASKPFVTGSVGNNLVVEAMDEDLDPFNSVWRWNVGNATGYDELPTKLIDSNALAAQSTWIQTVNGVRAGAHYSPEHDKWYLIQNRTDGNQVGLLVVEADDVDGSSPTVVWDSLVFSQDPNGDFDPADALDGDTVIDGNQDVFRRLGDLTLSPDGTKLLLHRIAAQGNNPHSPGAVMIIPLDDEGVPDVEVSEGMLTNVESIVTIGNDLGHLSGAQLEFDAAGNLYVANSGFVAGDPAGSAQLIQVFSPGGNSVATTTSSGMFNVQFTAPPDGVLGDYNNNGVVDAADYVVWRDQPASLQNEGASPGVVDQMDYDFWRARFGAMSGSGGGVATVPEPSTLLLVALAITALGCVTRRPNRDLV